MCQRQSPAVFPYYKDTQKESQSSVSRYDIEIFIQLVTLKKYK